MTAADRMVVRTQSGAYRSMPRRQALGLIAAGRAKAAPAPDIDELREPFTVEETPGLPGPAENITTGEITAPGEPLPPVEDDGEDLHAWFDEQAREHAEQLAATPPTEPRGNASRAVWADYAQQLGVTVTPDMSRDTIREAAKTAESDARLPQPAPLVGGRLETPEDEPAPESTGADDGPDQG